MRNEGETEDHVNEDDEQNREEIHPYRLVTRRDRSKIRGLYPDDKLDDRDDEVDEIIDLSNDDKPDEDNKLGGAWRHQPILVQLLRAMMDRNRAHNRSQQQIQNEISEESRKQRIMTRKIRERALSQNGSNGQNNQVKSSTTLR